MIPPYGPNSSIIEKFFQPLVCADAKVMVAVMADLKVFFQLAFVKMLAALFATDEDILSADDAILLAYRLDLAFLFAKPGHRSRGQRSDVSIQHFRS